MISFDEWMNEIAVSGGFEPPAAKSLRRPYKLEPDSTPSRIFRVRFEPSSLSMLRSFATDSAGLPSGVQEVLDSMEGGVAMMSNADAEAFRRVARSMSGAGGVMARAGAEVEQAIEDAVSEAVK